MRNLFIGQAELRQVYFLAAQNKVGDRIVATVIDEEVFTRTTGQAVITAAAIQRIVPVTTIECVIAAAAPNFVVLRIA